MWFFYSLYFALWAGFYLTIAKKLTFRLHPFSIMLTETLLLIFSMGVILVVSKQIPQTNSPFFILVFASSILDSIAFTASFYAVKNSNISLISPIASFNPVFTTLIAAVAIYEIPTLSKFIGIMLVVIGAYVLNISDIKSGLFVPFKKLMNHRGVQLFLFANFLWGITPILQKKAIALTIPSSPLFVSWVGIMFTAVLILPFGYKYLLKERKVVLANAKWFALVIPFTILAQWAAFTAFSLQNVGYVTAIFKLSVLFTVILGGLFFKEKHIKERLVGVSIMLLGTILLVV